MFRAAVGVSDLHWIWFLSEHWFTEPALQWISLTVSVFYSPSCVYLSSWGLFVAVCKCIMGLVFFFFFFLLHKNKTHWTFFHFDLLSFSYHLQQCLIFIIWALIGRCYSADQWGIWRIWPSEPLVSSSLMVPLTPGTALRVTQDITKRSSGCLHQRSSHLHLHLFLLCAESHWLWSLSGTAHCANMYPARAEDLPQLSLARDHIFNPAPEVAGRVIWAGAAANQRRV